MNWKIVTQAFGKSGKAKILTEKEAAGDPHLNTGPSSCAER